MSSPNGSSFTRRRALKIGALAGIGGGAAALYKLGQSKSLGANADVRIGVVGLRGKGANHLEGFREIDGCRIVALCDADSEWLDREKAISDKAGENAKTYSDVRSLLDDKDVDAVVIATPNHWHALMATWAIEAGKHVYVEKPLTHSLWEGEKLIASAEKSGLVAQTGTQRRSDMAYAEAKAWLEEGHIGKIKRARAVVYNKRNRLTKRKSPTEIPGTLNYDMWCGPAAKDTLYRSKVHYDWHWMWNTGNGELGNNGIHFVDVARWILDDPGLPSRALSIGGRFAWDQDTGETANTQITWFDGPVPIIAEIRNLPMKPGMEAMDHLNGVREGLVIECEGGTLSWPVARDSDGKKLKKFGTDDGHGHRYNWLKAIVDNKPCDVNAPLSGGHISTALCHLGNLSHRLGATAPTEEIRTGIAALGSGDIFDSVTEHLATHEIDLEKAPITLGRVLETDGKSLIGSAAEAAVALDRRPMRAPYQFAS